MLYEAIMPLACPEKKKIFKERFLSNIHFGGKCCMTVMSSGLVGNVVSKTMHNS